MVPGGIRLPILHYDHLHSRATSIPPDSVPEPTLSAHFVDSGSNMVNDEGRASLDGLYTQANASDAVTPTLTNGRLTIVFSLH